MFIINKKYTVFLYLSAIVFVVFSTLNAQAKLSKEDEKALEDLSSVSKPKVSIFGRVDDPIKTGISIYSPPPEMIPSKPEPKIEETIKLSPENQVNETLSGLKEERNDLHKSEEIGLNFIQPSLQLTQEEQKAIDEFFSRNEQEQLLNLWKSTIERNKTIQFIIQKLSPQESKQESNSVLSKTLGAAIFLPFYALQAFTNNAGAYYGSQVGGRVLGSVVEGKMKKNEATMQLSQTETIILFMMVDEVAERLRQRYHSYKRLMVERTLATEELEEAKKDSVEALDTKSQSAELLTGIQRRAMEREVRRIDSEIRAQKNSLLELAGPEAVAALDVQLQIELAATKNTPTDWNINH